MGYKQKIKRVIKAVIKVKLAISLIALLMIGAALAPDLHKEYLLNSAEGKVFRLVNPDNLNSGGTGFVIQAASGKPYILTNMHVCDITHTNFLVALDPKGKRAFRANIVEISTTTDLCLLELPSPMPGFKTASGVDINETVRIVGHPLLQPRSLTEGQLTGYDKITLVYALNITEQECKAKGGIYQDTTGTLIDLFLGVKSVCNRTIRAGRTTAISYPGNSGSPVLNAYGHVVGVLFAGDERTHWGYIVPLDDVEEFLSAY